MMRNRKASLLCIMITLVVILTVSPSFNSKKGTRASTCYYTDDVSGFDAVINAYSLSPDITYSVSSVKHLRDISSGEFEYSLCKLSPFGFAVIHDATGYFLEGSFDEGSLSVVEDVFANFDLGDVYYGGPLTFILVGNGSAKDILRDEIVTNESLEKAGQNVNSFKSFIEVNSCGISSRDAFSESGNRSTYVDYSVEPTYFAGLNDFGHNDSDTCTVIASQILLGYYDEYVNDNFVASVYEQNDGTTEAFHQLLNGYVYGSSTPGGIFIRNAVPGLNSYLLTRNVCAEFGSEYGSQSSAITKIIQYLGIGYPVIASMSTGYGADYNHTALIYRVQYNYSYPLTTAVFTMNMGWDTASDFYCSYVASAGWFYECGYIDYNAVHTYSGWTYYNTLKHTKVCTECGHSLYAPHSYITLGGVTYCSACGYVNGGTVN